MNTSNTLEQIAQDITLTAQEQEKQLYQNEKILSKIQQARQLIQDFTVPEKKNFTFTIGELNAYLG